MGRGIFAMTTIAVVVALTVAARGRAALTVAYNTRAPALSIDARGNAEVSWRDARGVRRTVVVRPSGRVLRGGRLTGRDVSRPIQYALPFKVVVRRTPDGRLWALQRWRLTKNGAVELRLARWRGAPTRVTATVNTTPAAVIEGTVCAGGRPVFGYSRTAWGSRIRDVVYIDFEREEGRWRRTAAAFPGSPDGSFRVQLPFGVHGGFRVTAVGPNRGTMLYPDARSAVEQVGGPPPPPRP